MQGGTVKDIITGAPVLVSVETQRNGQRFGTVTNDAGVWSYPFAPGELVTFTGVGYKSMTVPASTLGAWSLVELEPSTTELDPFTVFGTRRNDGAALALGLLALLGLAALSNRNRRRA